MKRLALRFIDWLGTLRPLFGGAPAPDVMGSIVDRLEQAEQRIAQLERRNG
jgi:hypothetical protein